MILNFFYTIHKEMLKGNFSFAILIFSIIQVALIIKKNN
jgi:hypothetical protein